MPNASLVGQHLGSYRLIRLLGRGGMGEVYEAQERDTHQQHAIKVLRAAGDHQSRRLFRREVRSLATLSHEKIVPLLAWGETTIAGETVCYLVMPYYRDGSLAQWWARQQRRPLPPTQVASLLLLTADPLQHAHDHHVLHLDIKPANFLLAGPAGVNGTIKLVLADFGIARLSRVSTTLSQTVRGTPLYMAPEQWRGRPTAASDQYALAVMAYTWLLGQPPFVGTMEQLLYQHTQRWPVPPSKRNPALSYLDVVLLQALAKSEDWRYPSVTDFADAFLCQVLNEEDRQSWLDLVEEHDGLYVPL